MDHLRQQGDGAAGMQHGTMFGGNIVSPILLRLQKGRTALDPAGTLEMVVLPILGCNLGSAEILGWLEFYPPLDQNLSLV